MISSVFHRRRSDRLAQLIDEASGGRRHHVRSGVDDNLADLVAVSRRLAELPLKIEAHPEFRDGLRAMLMATIEREGIGATAIQPEPEVGTAKRRGRLVAVGGGLRRPRGARPPLARRTKARGAIVIGLAAGTLALSGMSAASGSANPGDTLYSMKRTGERAQLALAGSDNSRGQLYLEFARTRLDEAKAVSDDAGDLGRVLDDMDAETQQGVKLLTTASVDHKDGSALDAIDTFVTGQRTAATKLRDGVTGEAHTRANRSLALLDEIQRRSQALRMVLKCGAAATSGPDALGPLPKASACKAGNGRSNAPSGQQNSVTGNTNRPQGNAPEGTVPDAGPNTVITSAPAEKADQPATPGTPAPTTTRGGLLDGLHGLVGG